MNYKWLKIWQRDGYYFWERKTDDTGKYIYNVTKDENPPANQAGYYKIWWLIKTKGIILTWGVIDELASVIERQ